MPLGLGEQGDAADHVAVPAQVLGGRVDDHGRPVLDGPAQVRRGHGVVDHQGHAGGRAGLGQGGQVGHGHGRVGDRLGVDGPGGRAQGGPDGGRVAGVDEADLDAEAGGGVGQQRVGPAVQVALGDHVVAGPGQRQQHGGDGAHARGGGQALGRALQVGDGRLQGGGGRVLVAGVDVALPRLAQGVGVVLGVVEDEGRGLPDRGGQRRLGRQGQAAGVDRAGGEAVSHRCSSHAGRRAGYRGAAIPAAALARARTRARKRLPWAAPRTPRTTRTPPSRATSRVRRPDTSTADSWS